MPIIRAGTIQRKRDSTAPTIQDIFHSTGGSSDEKSKTRPSRFRKLKWMVIAVSVVSLFMHLLRYTGNYADLDAALAITSQQTTNNSNNNNNNNKNHGEPDRNFKDSKSKALGQSSTTLKVDGMAMDDTCNSMAITEIPTTSNWNTKPLWIAGFPRSGAGSEGWSPMDRILPPIIEQLTTRKVHKFEGGENCLTDTEQVVACVTSFPKEKIAKPFVTRESFHSTVLLTTRDVTTALPAAQQDYVNPNTKKQLPKEKWLAFRDEWVTNPSTIAKWRSSVVLWTKYFNDAVVIPYEHLFDDTKGPRLVSKLANVLRLAGFDTVPETEIPCIWYKTIQTEREKQKAYFQYIPKYTQSQIDHLISSLQNFVREQDLHADLIHIFKEYLDNLKLNPPLE